MSDRIIPGTAFLYNGKPFTEQNPSVSQNGASTVYDFGGFTFTRTVTEYPAFGAVEWVSSFENTSDAPSGLVSGLYDCECLLPFDEMPTYRYTAYLPDVETGLQVIAPKGSTWCWDEYYCPADQIVSNRYVNLLFNGGEKQFHTSGGRSSEEHAPFFQIHLKDRGCIVAVGWSGQWCASVKGTPEGVVFRSGVENVSFRVDPGERFRTSGVVILPYEGSKVDGCNKWRRFVKACISPIGKGERPAAGPFCAGVWGGMSTEGVLKRIRIIKEEKLPFETIWMDAGWYGMSEKDSPDEYEGDWAVHTGDWRVNPTHHPDDMQEIKKAVKDAGLKFLLWFEPQRVIWGTPITKEHPEFFLTSDGKPAADRQSVHLNLGEEKAWKWCYEMLSERIETLGVSVYREDYNFAPLPYWRAHDTKDRQGMTEILHINGFYRLWDALLERFPKLLIDNCASGGRRIDIETLRRSIPMWRSDAQCPANFPVRLTQAHSVSDGQWFPYSGTGTGRAYDTYRFRSSFAPAMTTNFTFSERDDFGSDPEKLAWLKARGEEFLRVRPYLSCDLYPLTEPNPTEDVWAAVRYDRPEENDGVILVYRRERAPYSDASFKLAGLDPEKRYVFTDVDRGELGVYDGRTLASDGLPVRLTGKRSAAIIFYRAL